MRNNYLTELMNYMKKVFKIDQQFKTLIDGRVLR
jgi:hypothetical protein